MGRIKQYDQIANSTADCVRILNSFKQGDWKRKAKFSLKVSSDGDTHIVRVFTSGTEVATIISADDRETYLLPDINLHEHKATIDKINNIAKFYYTHDYESVWYDPYENKVWVTGGDGGIVYSEESPQVVKAKMDNEGFDGEGDTPHFHTLVAELNDSVFEAEANPDTDEEDYILIGHINDICGIEASIEFMSTEDLKYDLKKYEREERFEKCAEIQAELKKREKK